MITFGAYQATTRPVTKPPRTAPRLVPYSLSRLHLGLHSRAHLRLGHPSTWHILQLVQAHDALTAQLLASPPHSPSPASHHEYRLSYTAGSYILYLQLLALRLIRPKCRTLSPQYSKLISYRMEYQCLPLRQVKGKEVYAKSGTIPPSLGWGTTCSRQVLSRDNCIPPVGPPSPLIDLFTNHFLCNTKSRKTLVQASVANQSRPGGISKHRSVFEEIRPRVVYGAYIVPNLELDELGLAFAFTKGC